MICKSPYQDFSFGYKVAINLWHKFGHTTATAFIMTDILSKFCYELFCYNMVTKQWCISNKNKLNRISYLRHHILNYISKFNQLL